MTWPLSLTPLQAPHPLDLTALASQCYSLSRLFLPFVKTNRISALVESLNEYCFKPSRVALLYVTQQHASPAPALRNAAAPFVLRVTHGSLSVSVPQAAVSCGCPWLRQVLGRRVLDAAAV